MRRYAVYTGLLLASLYLPLSSAHAVDVGLFVGFNCNTLTPGASNTALCLQLSDSGDLDGGVLYRWNGSIWSNANITDIIGDGSAQYAADTGSSDAYASCPVALSEVGAYITGAIYAFKAATINTGAATWNGCGFGAKTMKKVSGGAITDLEDGDIPAGKVVIVQYDGTNWQMQSPAATVTGGGGEGTPGGSDTQVQFNDASAFGGDAGLTYNKTTNVLTITGGACMGDCDSAYVGYDPSDLTAARTRTLRDVDGAEAVTTGTLTSGDFTKFNSSGQIVRGGSARKSVQLEVFGPTTANSTGDGKYYYRVPTSLNGMDLVAVNANVIAAGTTGTLNIDIARCAATTAGAICTGTGTSISDMLSTNLTIDTGENDTATAAAAAVINTSADDVATGQVLRIDIDAVHTTPATGLILNMEFALP
jgi:hypothetical protein